MAESQPEQGFPEPDPAATVIRPAVPSAAAPKEAITAAAASSEEEDAAPTIISRPNPSQNKAEQILGGNLRGRRLAHFELLEPVGVGGMAAVLRANDTQLDRIVALKILPPAMATDPENVRRFHQEARSAARLDHENVARVFFCGEDQGLHFIAFEFVEGENLRVILERHGSVPVADSVHYMLQLATGLAHAANRGVVHRDIKPSNIIITPNGRAKLVDMGLARSLGHQADGSLTQSGVTLGTFDYISPEQALEPRDADVRSDIYSLGCTFYHMLTGQPPVPEGTAARKLHHHQNVLPVDPRQLNPAVSDEVAAVLDRMMAKDPKDRYQRAEHLVQHLLQVANKLGNAPEGAGGVLFVDAPLPAQPRARPVLVAAASVGLLVGLIAVFGGSTSVEPPDVRLPPPSAPEILVAKGPASTDHERPPPTPISPTVATPQWQAVRNTRGLAEALRQPSPHIELAPGRYDLVNDLGTGDAPGLLFAGKELEIRAQNPDDRPVIRLGYKPMRDQPPPWAALTIVGGQVRLTGLRFIVDAAATDTMMAAILHREGGTLQLEQCEFSQVRAADESDHRRLTSILVAEAPATGKPPEISLSGCYLAGGEQGVFVTTAATVQLVNCACGPHAALVRFGSSSREADTNVGLRHCSALLDNNSTAFLFDEGAGGRVVASHCLFSAPAAATASENQAAVLLRQLSDSSRNIHFECQYPNAFHALPVYWMRAGRVVADTLERFRSEADLNGSDASAALAASPWQADRPLELLSKDPARAFLVNVKLPQVRQPDSPSLHILGVEDGPWGRMYKQKLPAIEELRPDLARKTKIVDPNVKESGLGVYPGITQAVADAQPGDTILLRFNGEQVIDPVRLERSSVDLTIRPHPGFTPVLLPGPGADPEAAVFRLFDGRLVLEDLEFRVRIKRNDYKGLSAVLLAGDGQCIFKRCVATLEGGKEMPVALVGMADPAAAMKMEPGTVRSVPQIQLDSCFVRGDGNLVGVRASRPFNLDVDESLVAIDGSFVEVESNPREPATRPAVQVSLKQTTAFLGESLFALHGNRDESKAQVGLVTTQVTQVTGCLFASARGNRSLIQIDGIDTDEQMKRFFSWGDGKQNVYSNFGSLIEQRPRGDSMSLPPYDKDKWAAFTTRDTEPQFTKVKFAGWPAGDRMLMGAAPELFKVTGELPRCGPTIDKLPRPAGERISPSSTTTTDTDRP
jgi:serine/threonine protein kinase